MEVRMGAKHYGSSIPEEDKHIEGEDTRGLALPNDFEKADDKTHDRGWAKVKDCDPEYIQDIRERRSGVRNDQIWETMRLGSYDTRNKRDNFIRNRRARQIPLSSWWRK